jgi:glycosyltransferase involved in cell wall biosynthesis
MSKISIIAVNVDSPEWAELLVQSIRKFTTVGYEIIIVDNGSLEKNIGWLRRQADIVLIENGKNYGHGGGMDIGVRAAKYKYCCVLDIDSFLQREGWAKDLISIYESKKKIKMLGCVGPQHKPLHPPLFFFEKKFVLENEISFEHIPGVSTDTAQKAYWDILALDFEVKRFKKGSKVYECKGDELWIKNKPTIYHHWYGTRFRENVPGKEKQILDGFTLQDHKKNKALLFSQPEVKEILKYKRG